MAIMWTLTSRCAVRSRSSAGSNSIPASATRTRSSRDPARLTPTFTTAVSVSGSADEIRASATVALGGPVADATPTGDNIRSKTDFGAGLLYHGAGDSWGKLHGNARIERTSDLPPLQTETEAKAMEAKFARFRSLATMPGDLAQGRQIFASTCGACHSVGGQGGKIGPVLDGAGANGLEALLRNILAPNAAMEAGYRRFRVETRDGDVLEGLFVSQDDDAIVLRQPNVEDLRIPRGTVKRSGFTRLS